MQRLDKFSNELTEGRSSVRVEEEEFEEVQQFTRASANFH